MNKNWKIIKGQSHDDNARTRDVHGSQNVERGKDGEVESTRKYRVTALLLAVLVGLAGFLLGSALRVAAAFYSFLVTSGGASFLKFDPASVDVFSGWHIYAWTAFVFGFGWLILDQRMMMTHKSRNSMFDGTDINSYENDQRIMLLEESHETFDWYPNMGAHSSVQVSSVLSHVMVSRKGLKNVEMVVRHKKDVVEDGHVIIPAGSEMYDSNGVKKVETLPLIDEALGQELFTASGIPVESKKIRRPVDVRNIPYNPKTASGQRKYMDKQPYDTVGELINKDWEIPEYEVQRPTGAYLVDTAPVNTMVLAITRGGKGQTVIEPTIDMWTREKRPNNIVINDPKGELLYKFFVPATVRGYEIVQFNLINPINTDIYNPLGFAAESAREGDFTKAASYIENIGDIFFPKEGADDPMWPNAANNAFKRSAFGLIDFYLEEEKRVRKQAEVENTPEKVLQQELDDMWGKVTLYNAYQLFVVLSAKKSSDLEYIKFPDEGDVKEKDYLTLFFDATARLPQNEMRKLVQNTDNALRAMAGSDKTIASVYGIALTAMSFFTDPTISTLTSGKPSQNFDAKGLSFPRRIGVRFASEYMEKFKYAGLQSHWEAYEDKEFTQKLDSKLFGHMQTIDREGWARYFFDGKFTKRKNYIKLLIRNPKTELLVKTFYFELELMYKTDLSGRRYIKDPVLGTKIIRDGVLREMRRNRRTKQFEFKDTLIKRQFHDLLNPEKGEQTVELPAFSQKSVKYAERPKAIFFITPPHLMSYAKLILILIKQMVDVNFESSYLTKENQKPLYKTRYMLDEVGNLQSEGNGIPALQTMLSIGLGQDQQFTLILQTLQQLRDVYGDSVDKIIQGNTENIVFLKSTDDSMIETLVKMSGVTHESRTDSKTITRDNDRLLNKTDAKISYTRSTRERPVIQFNDFMFIEPRNSIIIKAGVSPLWNRNESAYPMSWLMFKNQIKIPGKKFTLQTVPTNSTAMDFDIRKNQPDFFAMLDQRIKQAALTIEYKQAYLDAYDISESELIRRDQNVVSDDIMHAVNGRLFNIHHRPVEDRLTEEEMEQEFDEFGEAVNPDGLLQASVENVELTREQANAEAEQSSRNVKRYAGGHISRENLEAVGGMVNRQLDGVLARAYDESRSYFVDSADYRVNPQTGELSGARGELYVKASSGANRTDVEQLEQGELDEQSRIFGDAVSVEVFFEVTDAFIKHLAGLDSWDHIASGRFESEAKRAYEQLKM